MRKWISIAWGNPDMGVQWEERRVIADVDGLLAVHKVPESDGLYSATHVPSGYALGHFQSRDNAIVFREGVKDVWDWAKADPRKKGSGVPAKVYKLVKELRAGCGGV
jgi:hypothetical protein